MAEEPERVLTVCGLSALLDVLEQRAAQLQHLPEKVDQRDDWGTKKRSDRLLCVRVTFTLCPPSSCWCC
jgi:hypothetical protein